jgi:hypothetical protein
MKIKSGASLIERVIEWIEPVNWVICATHISIDRLNKYHDNYKFIINNFSEWDKIAQSLPSWLK